MDSADWDDLFGFDDGEFCRFCNDLAEGFGGVSDCILLTNLDVTSMQGRAYRN